jgi:hypothetical protein
MIAHPDRDSIRAEGASMADEVRLGARKVLRKVKALAFFFGPRPDSPVPAFVSLDATFLELEEIA